jgi:hypothetical protein
MASARRGGEEAAVALEFHIITSHEFLRFGSHGEVDWKNSLESLKLLARQFLERGTDLALVDARDAQTHLTDEQVETVAAMLHELGFRQHHRVAVLHRIRPHPMAAVFVEKAVDLGFCFAEFVSYEKAAEWLSTSDEEDPDFDRDTYYGPTGEREPEPPKGQS